MWLPPKILRDHRGNILPIMAGALIPLLILMGSGLDLSRAYMAQSRLQHACDSAVLSARQAAGPGGFDDAAKKTGTDHFYTNYKQNWLSDAKVTFDLTASDSSSEIIGNAKSDIDTSVMAIFGKKILAISAECTADQSANNLDISLVLDYSLSMQNKTSDGVTRIEALKTAVKNFHDTLDRLTKTSNTRVRYSFVPFAGNVNTGKLVYDLNPQYIVGGKANESAQYNSRRPIAKNDKPAPTPRQFDRWIYSTYTMPVALGDYVHTIADGYSGNGEPRPTDNQYWTGKTTAPVRDKWQGCMEEPDTDSRGRRFRYSPANGITSPEARDPLYDLDIDHIPDVNKDATRFRPQWQEISFFYNTRTGNNTEYYNVPPYIDDWRVNGYDAGNHGTGNNNVHENDDDSFRYVYQIISCPPPATQLQEMDKSYFYNYVDNAPLTWGTMHDIGLIWGGRIMSAQGMFAKNVTKTPGNNLPVGRHMIMMTDGLSALVPFGQSAWGMTLRAQRLYNYPGGISANNVMATTRFEVEDLHYERIAAICESIKAKGIKLWTISFGLPVSTSMRNCASPGSSFEAQSADELNTIFQEIAGKASGLQLTG